jgi:hypothetical protein
MVDPKKEDFWRRINKLKEKKKKITVRQKLGMILENKVIQKLKLEHIFFTKDGLLN